MERAPSSRQGSLLGGGLLDEALVGQQMVSIQMGRLMGG